MSKLFNNYNWLDCNDNKSKEEQEEENDLNPTFLKTTSTEEPKGK